MTRRLVAVNSEPSPAADAALIDWAHWYARAWGPHGLRLFPVTAKRPHKSLAHWPEQASIAGADLEEWWGEGSKLRNVTGIGATGVLVVDGDELDETRKHFGDDLDLAPSWSGRPGRASFIFAQPDPPLGNGNHPGGQIKGHRGYVVLPPSLWRDDKARRPDKAYEWTREPSASLSVPSAAILGLLGDLTPSARAARRAQEIPSEWLTGGEPCSRVAYQLDKLSAALSAADAAKHPAATAATLALLRFGEQGHPGVSSALDTAESIFLDACFRVSRQRLVEGRREWIRLAVGAVDVITAEPSDKPYGCDCAPDPGLLEPPAIGELEPCTLDDVRRLFVEWFGPSWDLGIVDAVLAAGASSIHHDGDPLWLLIVGGSGVGKTEACQSLAGAGALVRSTLSGEAALLSGSPRSQRAAKATGGLLHELGASGLLVLKDFTTILSMNRDARAALLAALREVYDGKWTRSLGTDGGRSIGWEGRATVVGGVTSAYDSAHAVISSMGDRFVLIRCDSDDADVRQHAIAKALTHGGDETTMREQLAAAVGGLLHNVKPWAHPFEADTARELAALADFVSRARTTVESDYRGEPQWAHSPDMGTRLAKQLGQLYRGARTVGMSQSDALGLARRVALDSVPPRRLAVLRDVAKHPGSTATGVTSRCEASRTTTDRVLQSLHMLKLLDRQGGSGSGWTYTIAAGSRFPGMEG